MSSLYRAIDVNRQEFVCLSSEAGRKLLLAAHLVTLVTEALGSFFIGLVGYTVAATATTGVAWEIAPAFGLSVAVMHAAFIARERCAAVDFNPAFTLVSFLTGYYSIIKLAVMLAGQCAGWSAAGALVSWQVGAGAMAGATTTPTIDFGRQLLFETLLTAMVALVVVLGTRHSRTLAISLLIGVAITVALVASRSLGAGASLNFARSLGAAVGAGTYYRLGCFALSNAAAALLVAALLWGSEWVVPFALTYERMRNATIERTDTLFDPWSLPTGMRDDPVLMEELKLLPGTRSPPTSFDAAEEPPSYFAQ